MRRIRVLSFALLLAAATIPARAGAQPPPSSIDAASSRADELAHQGNDLALKHSWADAEALFLQAWALKQSYDIGGNLGIAELNLEKYCDAAEHLSFALKRFPANGKADHRELLHDKLEKAKEHVGTLTITVSAPGAEVFADGKRLGVAPLPDVVFLEPGTRKIEARLSGHDTATQMVEVANGKSSETALTLRESATASPPATPGGGPKTGLLVAGGVTTGAALVAGIVFAALSNGKASDADAEHTTLVTTGGSLACAGAAASSTGCGELRGLWKSKDTLGSAAGWSFIGAGVAGTATLIYALAAPRKQSSGLRIAPTVTAQSGGIVVLGAW